MRSQGILAAIVASMLAGFSAGAMAQAANPDAEAEARAARQNAITDRYLTAVPVEMASKVDTKNATVGQEVSAKTLAEVRLADGTELPKGTRLVGHVIRVRAGGQELGSAILTLTFDRAEVKPGQSVPVRSVIRAVAQSAAAKNRDLVAEPPAILPPSSGSASTTGRGGVAGGMPGTTMPTIGSVGGGVGASTIPGVGMPGTTGTSRGGMPGSTGPSVPDADPGTVGRATDAISLGGTSSAPANRKVSDAGESLSGAPRATGLPGVLLWATPTASGTLTAMGKNISLDSGIQMTLGVITR